MLLSYMNYLVILILSILITYYVVPISQSIQIKYPTIENYKKLTFVDDSGVCYRYKLVQVN